MSALPVLGSSPSAGAASAQSGGDLVRSYLRDIGRVPLLSHEQEITLGRQVQELVGLEELELELEVQLGNKPSQAELAQGQGLHPVGRLDFESRGALLISNQGDLTLKLTHPRYSHRKTYRVWLRGRPSPDQLKRWAEGLPLDGKPSQPVAIATVDQGADATCLELVMGEGRNRQIRRTAAALGFTVLDLQRVAFGPIGLDDLPEGRWRRLAQQEWLALIQNGNL